ncbi:MAG: YihY/virulence factor BrkB family protein, partial [Thermoanaerobaculia bacterium]|nr:YihY/virulence factor BrkB family protein [Thermoanaerobaculia bacterium]
MKTAWSDPVQRLATTAGWHVRQLLTRPGEELSLLHRTAAFWIRLSISCARKLRRDRASQVAAALTYQTLFSLVPTVVLALLLFSSVQGLDGASERARSSVIDFVLPDSLVGATAAGEEVSGTGSEEFDDAREILRVRIDELLQRLEEVNLAGIGLIGLAAFLYGATSLMSTIEGSFNSIYQAEETRPLTIRLHLSTPGSGRLMRGHCGSQLVEPLAFSNHGPEDDHPGRGEPLHVADTLQRCHTDFLIRQSPARNHRHRR